MDKTPKANTFGITAEQIDTLVYPPTFYLAKIYHYLTKSKDSEKDINREVWQLIRGVPKKLQEANIEPHTKL